MVSVCFRWVFFEWFDHSNQGDFLTYQIIAISWINQRRIFGNARMHWTRATASIGTVPWARGPLLSRSTQQDGHMVWSRPSPEVSLKVLELPTRVVSSLACRCGSKLPISNMEVLADLSPQYCRLDCLQIGYPYIWCLITIFLTHNLSLVGSVPIFLPLLSHEFCMSIYLINVAFISHYIYTWYHMML